VLRCPAIISVYDDGYGISVTNENQVAKENISELLAGFERPPGECCDGYDIYTVKGWDYPALIEAYSSAAEVARGEHMPAIIHVSELTQPQGHSTSGSHERYKSEQRLAWEQEYDCINRFRLWILEQGIASEEQLAAWEEQEREYVEAARKEAWGAYLKPIIDDREKVSELIDQLAQNASDQEKLLNIRQDLNNIPYPLRRDLSAAVQKALIVVRGEPELNSKDLLEWRAQLEDNSRQRYSSHLYLEKGGSALQVGANEPIYSSESPTVYGFEVLNACFDAALAREPRLVAFGEDVGKLGDVNQAFRGLQDKYGILRVSDTGIREATILGQAIGMAMRGLRPLAEIQYLDYLLYALQLISDDLATLHWRTKGGQKAPVIIRTRGHRLEGIWHSGSPMAGIIHLARGIHVLVPRNMTQAAGFYNTILLSDEPALIVEVLNGYRLKERLPDNIGQFTVPLGVPEIIRTGSDLTIVTYGACCRIVMEAAERLIEVGINAEVIDVQSLLPFDVNATIVESLKKTSRAVFVDEDVPGGTTAYMMREVLEKQGGYNWLDSSPLTLPGKAHRPAYGSDGDYWSKPNVESIFEAIYRLMNEVDPKKYPIFF